MAGLLSVARYLELAPESQLSGSALAGYLAAAQAIAERLSGMVFGAEITAVESLGDDLYKLTIGSPVGELGSSVRLIGGGVAATPFEIVDGDRTSITVESTVAITTATTKVLPIIEHVDQPVSGHIYCPQRPVFSVVSVQTRSSSDTLWSEATEITTLTSDQYEVFTGKFGIKTGVKLKQSAIPRVAEGGEWLVKRMTTVSCDSVKVRYVAGFYVAVPADLETAALEIVNAIAQSVEEGGALASESIDYYSYQRLTYDQLAAVPTAAVATFSRYSSY